MKRKEDAYHSVLEAPPLSAIRESGPSSFGPGHLRRLRHEAGTSEIPLFTGLSCLYCSCRLREACPLRRLSFAFVEFLLQSAAGDGIALCGCESAGAAAAAAATATALLREALPYPTSGTLAQARSTLESRELSQASSAGLEPLQLLLLLEALQSSGAPSSMRSRMTGAVLPRKAKTGDLGTAGSSSASPPLSES